jgi:hypothetical protein
MAIDRAARLLQTVSQYEAYSRWTIRGVGALLTDRVPSTFTKALTRSMVQEQIDDLRGNF